MAGCLFRQAFHNSRDVLVAGLVYEVSRQRGPLCWFSCITRQREARAAVEKAHGRSVVSLCLSGTAAGEHKLQLVTLFLRPFQPRLIDSSPLSAHKWCEKNFSCRLSAHKAEAEVL